MGGSDRETAEHAAPGVFDRDVLCGSVVVERTFMVELPAMGVVTIGRDGDVDLQLGHASVSRQHARLELHGDHGTVIDLGSRNGTFIDGERLGKAAVRVARGDEIAFGSTRMALLARAMVPAGVRALLVRSALLQRIDALLAEGDDVELLALKLPRRWYEMEGIASWLALLPAELHVGMLSEQAIVVAAARGVPLPAPPHLGPGAESGVAKQRDARADSAEALVTAALRALAQAKSATVGAATRAVYDEAATIAPTMVNVLLVGETGVGKEVLARFIHERSGRKGAMISVNTAALPESLVESELFGHEKGAFSGAQQAKTGLIEAAHGGTLFLDEIGDLPLALQAKLLRVLEERTVRRVGATQERAVDVRVVAATHRDLERLVEAGTFRRDLLFRLNACTLRIPPLRARMDEIDHLAEELLRQASRASRGRPAVVSPAAAALLRAYAWPGNVRELRNVLERGAALAQAGGVLLPEHLPENVRHAAPGPATSAGGVRDSVKDYERRRIVDALEQCGGNQSKAAKLLGLPRRTLAYKMARLGIRSSD